MENEISQNKIMPYTPVVIKLLQGTVFDEEKKTWNELLLYQKPVRDYLGQIGIHLHLDESDGFAFLTQPDTDDKESRMPRLVRRMPLSYEVTQLLVILRGCLEEFDVTTTDSSKCFITRQEIVEKIELLFKEKADKVKLLSKFDAYINQVITFGFLKAVEIREAEEDHDRRYEIRRVIKAKINNEKLEEIKENLGQNDEYL